MTIEWGASARLLLAAGRSSNLARHGFGDAALTDIIKPPLAVQWPLPGAPATLSWTNWDWPPQNRWAFQHVGDLLRVARISRGYGPAWHFGSAPRDISGIAFTDADGRTRTVADMLVATYTDGFLLMHDGTVVTEVMPTWRANSLRNEDTSS